MIGRVFNFVAWACGLVALLGALAIAVSIARPTMLTVTRLDWDLHTYSRTSITVAVLMQARCDVVTIPLTPASGSGSRLLRPTQTDWTFKLERIAAPATSDGVRWTIAWPTLACAAGWAVVALPRSISRFRSTMPAAARRVHWPTRASGATAAALAVALVLLVIEGVRTYPLFHRVDLALPLTPGPEAIQFNLSRGKTMIAWTRAGPRRSLGGGAFAFVRSTIPPTRGPLYLAAELKGDFEQFAGFTLGTDGGSALPRNVLIVPNEALALTLGGPMLYATGFHRRLRRRRAELVATRCVHCGYDCRGLADRCPECGTPIVAAAGSSGPGG